MSQVVLVQEEPRGPTELIEVLVDKDGAARFKFPDDTQLRSDTNLKIVVKGMRLVTSDILVGGMLNDAPNAPLAELQKMAMVLYCEGWEKAQYIPVLETNDVATPAGTFPYRFAATKFDNWQNVDWNKSYIQFANGEVSANSPYVVIFDVDYVRFNAENKEIIGPA